MSRKQTRHLPAFLLLFLNEKKMYGNELIRQLESIAPKVIKIDSGGVYRALRDLERRGAISSEWLTDGEPRPKRLYTISESGKQELKRWYEDITGRLDMLTFFIQKYEGMN